LALCHVIWFGEYRSAVKASTCNPPHTSVPAAPLSYPGTAALTRSGPWQHQGRDCHGHLHARQAHTHQSTDATAQRPHQCCYSQLSHVTCNTLSVLHSSETCAEQTSLRRIWLWQTATYLAALGYVDCFELGPSCCIVQCSKFHRSVDPYWCMRQYGSTWQPLGNSSPNRYDRLLPVLTYLLPPAAG
jgi:hypothetical protein